MFLTFRVKALKVILLLNLAENMQKMKILLGI